MKELQLYVGGHPVRLDDLLHLQSGLKEALLSLLSGLNIGSNTTFIVTGCGVSTTSTSVTVQPGVIFSYGELYTISKAYTITINTAYKYYTQIGLKVILPYPVIAYPGYNTVNPGQDEAEVNYEIGTHNVHIVKEMSIVKSIDADLNTKEFPTKTLIQLISFYSSWGNPNASTQIVSNNSDLVHLKNGLSYKILDESNLSTIKPGLIDSTKTNLISPISTASLPTLYWGLKQPYFSNFITWGIIPITIGCGDVTGGTYDALHPNGNPINYNSGTEYEYKPNPLENLLGNAIKRSAGTEWENSLTEKYGYFSLSFFGTVSYNTAQVASSWNSTIINGVHTINNPNPIIKQAGHGATDNQEYYNLLKVDDSEYIRFKWDENGKLKILTKGFVQFAIVGHLYISYNIEHIKINY